MTCNEARRQQLEAEALTLDLEKDLVRLAEIADELGAISEQEDWQSRH